MKHLLFTLLFLTSWSAYAIEGQCQSDIDEYEQCKQNKKIFSRCESELIKQYSYGYDRELNQTLRGFENDPSCRKLGDLLKGVLLNLPATERRVYRGVTMWRKLDEIKIGDCFSDKGFSSTSASRHKALEFSKNIQAYITETNQPALLEIATLTGRDISRFSEIMGEREILLLPGTPMKLISRELDKNSVVILKFQEVSLKSCRNRIL